MTSVSDDIDGLHWCHFIYFMWMKTRFSEYPRFECHVWPVNVLCKCHVMVQIRKDSGAYVEHPCVTETQKHKATLPKITQLARGRAAF